MNVPLRHLCLSAVALCLMSAANGEEWGTLKGRFVYSGDAPVAAELKADKDVEVCGKHKLFNEELVVGADKGVANIVIFVRDKNVKVHPDAAAAATSAKVVLDNKDCRFEPHVTFVQAGRISSSRTPIRWVTTATLRRSRILRPTT